MRLRDRKHAEEPTANEIHTAMGLQTFDPEPERLAEPEPLSIPVQVEQRLAELSHLCAELRLEVQRFHATYREDTAVKSLSLKSLTREIMSLVLQRLKDAWER